MVTSIRVDEIFIKIVFCFRSNIENIVWTIDFISLTISSLTYISEGAWLRSAFNLLRFITPLNTSMANGNCDMTLTNDFMTLIKLSNPSSYNNSMFVTMIIHWPREGWCYFEVAALAGGLPVIVCSFYSVAHMASVPLILSITGS